MYNPGKKKIIYTALTRRELAALMDFVNDIDKNAFMSVFNTSQIYGRGFLPFDDN